MEKVVVSGSFDNLKIADIRFLEEAARFGNVQVYVWSDGIVNQIEQRAPLFPGEGRVYLLQGIRYVNQVYTVNRLFDRDTLEFKDEWNAPFWVVDEASDNALKRRYSASHGVNYHVIQATRLQHIPNLPEVVIDQHPVSKKVIVTGCYDWFHSGHLRFFEEASALGDLYVVVGSDQNVRLLKGDGHPLFSQAVRSYIVQAIRFVKQAFISSGSGWMDAEPEIARIKPDIYVVNEDGDKPEKQRFCETHGIDYVVLKRAPKMSLPRRESKRLRGF